MQYSPQDDSTGGLSKTESVPTGSDRAGSGKRLYFGLFLLALVLGSSWLGASYYFQHQNSRQLNHISITTKPNNNGTTPTPSSNITETYAEANELINYGNGTPVWYNKTNVVPGESSYDLTASVAVVNSSYSSGIGAHYVLAINNVWQNSTNYWTLWVYCAGANAWAASGWGADYLLIQKTGLEVKLLTGNISIGTDTFAWYYQRLSSTDPSTWEPPQPGANKVDQCW